MQDEGRFGLMATPKRCWTPIHTRPVIAKQIRREYVYAYTAVCPKLGRSTSLILPYANTEMMQLFLNQVSEDFSEYFIIMQVDQAGWHTTPNLVIPENIRLIEQPPYSPEVNPIELIWKKLKTESSLANKNFVDIEALTDVLSFELSALNDSPEALRSLTLFPHLNIISCIAC